MRRVFLGLFTAFVCTPIIVNAGQVRVEFFTVFGVDPPPQDFDDSVPIHLNPSANTTGYNIYHLDDPPGDIPHIFFDTAGINSVEVNFSSAAFSPQDTRPTFVKCNNLGGVTSIHDGVSLYGRIGGDLLGAIDVPRSAYLRIDGTLQADITIRAAGEQDQLECNSIPIGRAVSVVGNRLFDFDVLGDLDGVVSINSSSGLSVFDGVIGGNLNGSLAMNETFFDVQIVGDVTGSITCGAWVRSRIDGDVSGDIEITNGIPLGYNDFLRIGGGFTGDGRIILPEVDGLKGWISFNRLNSRANTTPPVWEDTAMIVFGNPLNPALTINTPAYSELPSALGGGTIGLAPFLLHGEACVPVRGSTIIDPVNFPSHITVRHYGLVQHASYQFGEMDPVDPRTHTIWRKKITDDETMWVDHSSSFTFTRVGGVLGSRPSWSFAIKATPNIGYSYLDGYEYKMLVNEDIANDDRLICLGVGAVDPDPAVADGTEPFIPAYTPEYRFQIGINCPADLNHDGFVDTADLGILLGNFGQTGNSPLGDINGDGVVDTADLGILLGTFGPCGAAAMAGGGGPTVSSFIAEMGFTSVEDYIAWLDTLSDQRLNQHIARILRWIEREN